MEELRTTLFFDDTDDLQEGSFELLPTGTHEFQVLEVRTGTAKSGRGRLGLQIEIVGEKDEAKGRKGWDNWNLPDPEKDDRGSRIYKFWKNVAKACPDAIKNDGNGTQRFLPEVLVGLRYRANVVHEDWEGRKVARLEWPYPLGKAEAPQSRPAAFSPPK